MDNDEEFMEMAKLLAETVAFIQTIVERNYLPGGVKSLATTLIEKVNTWMNVESQPSPTDTLDHEAKVLHMPGPFKSKPTLDLSSRLSDKDGNAGQGEAER